MIDPKMMDQQLQEAHDDYEDECMPFGAPPDGFSLESLAKLTSDGLPQIAVEKLFYIRGGTYSSAHECR